MGEIIPIGRSLAGGVLIGAGAGVLILLDGKIAGISGIFERVLHRAFGEQYWRLAFLAGLLLPALVLGTGAIDWQASPWLLAVAGSLVGFGTRLGSGCTSGHGVCGIANISPRSLVATLTFIAAGAATVGLMHWGCQ
jgi:uncharacterized protein